MMPNKIHPMRDLFEMEGKGENIPLSLKLSASVVMDRSSKFLT